MWFFWVFLDQMNETVHVFKVNGNKIGNKGAMAIAGSLQVNPVLQELDISDTDMVCMTQPFT